MEMEGDFSNIVRREETFSGWVLSDPSVRSMANAGFICTGPDDTVECYACGVKISQWHAGDKPSIRHQQSAPDCPLMEVVEDEGASMASGVTSDSGLGEMQYLPPSSGANRLPRIDSDLEDSDGMSSSVIVRSGQPARRRRPRSPAPSKYKQTEERKKSFIGSNWPAHLEAQPDKLVKAGFYFYSAPDRVKCAFCGGRLKNWQPHDSAIEEHISHFPDCSFVQNIEKQTAVLSKNIRSKKKSSNCVSSEDLMKKFAEERAQANRPSEKNLWRKTLKKMGYQRNLIRKAERNLKQNSIKLELTSVLEELNRLEKAIFLGEVRIDTEPSSDTDEGLASSEEEEEDAMESLCVDEQVEKLQLELRSIEHERDDLQNQMACKICLSNKVDTLFLTCRHFCTCHECADRVKDCPVCRQLILGTVDVFMV